MIENLPTCLHSVTEPAEVRQHFRVLVTKMLAGLATLPDFLMLQIISVETPVYPLSRCERLSGYTLSK